MRRRSNVLKQSAARIAVTVAAVGVIAFAAVIPAFAATYDPNLVISNDNVRNRDAMSEAAVQAFLDLQTGPLKSLVTTDHAGVKRKASTIIWQACQAWTISPRVMLTMLQKEQSLLTRTTLAKNTLSRAIGAGCPGGPSNRYPGFGRQMWNGARLLDGYGEGRPSYVPTYYPGIRKLVYGPAYVYPKNLATYKLYVYNPSIGAKSPYGDLSAQAGKCTGNANFWLIYRKYFGSTLAGPRMRPVYRFRNRASGSYLYTASLTERYHLQASKKTWHFDGAVFSSDTSVAATATVPMYRFYNKRTHRYSFVTSHATYVARRTTTGKRTWKYGGIAFRVARSRSTGAITVWRFDNKKTGSQFLTAAKSTRAALLASSVLKKTWRYRGVAFYLPRASTATTAAP